MPRELSAQTPALSRIMVHRGAMNLHRPQNLGVVIEYKEKLHAVEQA